MNMFIQYVAKGLITTLITLLLSASVLAETVVIISSSNSLSTLSKGDVKKIYLGKNKKLKAVDQEKGSNIRVEFLSKVVGKSEHKYKSFWSRKIFSGKGVPPKSLNNSSDVKKEVASAENHIGYIDSKDVDDSVKVIYRVK